MLRLRVLACWSLVFATSLAGSALAAEPAAKKRVVIVTGEDPAHDWRTTAPALKALLAKDPRLEVSVVEDLKFLASPELQKYDVLVIHFKNKKKDVPGPEGQKGLQQFVDAGRGVVLVHFACGAFQEWPDFVKIAGRVWNPKMRADDGYGKFQVDIVDTEHPITPQHEGIRDLRRALHLPGRHGADQGPRHRGLQGGQESVSDGFRPPGRPDASVSMRSRPRREGVLRRGRRRTLPPRYGLECEVGVATGGPDRNERKSHETCIPVPGNVCSWQWSQSSSARSRRPRAVRRIPVRSPGPWRCSATPLSGATSPCRDVSTSVPPTASWSRGTLC